MTKAQYTGGAMLLIGFSGFYALIAAAFGIWQATLVLAGSLLAAGFLMVAVSLLVTGEPFEAFAWWTDL